MKQLRGNGNWTGKTATILYKCLTTPIEENISYVTIPEYEVYKSAAQTTYSKGENLNKTVKSNDESAYPDNSYQGSYWYVKVQ